MERVEARAARAGEGEGGRVEEGVVEGLVEEVEGKKREETGVMVVSFFGVVVVVEVGVLEPKGEIGREGVKEEEEEEEEDKTEGEREVVFV